MDDVEIFTVLSPKRLTLADPNPNNFLVNDNPIWTWWLEHEALYSIGLIESIERYIRIYFESPDWDIELIDSNCRLKDVNVMYRL